MAIINPIIFTAGNTSDFATAFQSAIPFRHVQIEGFLMPDVADKLFNQFPPISQMRKKYNGINERKAEDASFDSLDPIFSALKETLASKDMLQWLEQVTGISQLFTVTDQRGAGLHQGENGSFLDIHIDFNIHPILNVHRRLNLIIFLQKDWQAEWGGQLEFWDDKVKHCMAKYSPVFNSCVIFETNEISYHGYSEISVPEHVSRKSYYNYYYTTILEGTKYHDTVFKVRPQEGFLKTVKTVSKDFIKNSAKSTFRMFGINTWFKRFE